MNTQVKINQLREQQAAADETNHLITNINKKLELKVLSDLLNQNYSLV